MQSEVEASCTSTQSASGETMKALPMVLVTVFSCHIASVQGFSNSPVSARSA